MENKPASEHILNCLSTDVLEKSVKSLNVTCVTFPGSGESSQLRYLIRNYLELPYHDKNHLFTFLDLSSYVENSSQALKEAVSFLITHFGQQCNSEVKELLNAFIADETSSFGSFIDLVNKITYNNRFAISFVLENFRRAYDGGVNAGTVTNLVESLKRQNPMNVSFVFLAEAEFGIEILLGLSELYEYFFQNVVLGKNLLFDGESVERLFSNQKEWHELNVSKTFISKVAELSYGDPVVVKSIASQALSDEGYEKAFLACSSEGDYFELLGREFLISRYERIVSLLKPESYNCLKSHCRPPTEFLLNTGLTTPDGKPLNPLLNYYIEKIMNDVPFASESNLANIYAILSGQELTLFKYLISKDMLVVSKDEIAQLIWSDSWEDNYSEWAIDKLISNLQKNLKMVTTQKQ